MISMFRFGLYYIYMKIQDSNINIIYEDHLFKYLCRLENDQTKIVNRWSYDNGYFYPKDQDTHIVRNVNEWNIIHSHSEYNLPETVSMAKITLFIPDYSVNTYISDVKYIFSASLKIENQYISLFEKIIDPLDLLPVSRKMRINGENYYQRYEVECIDPYSFIYSDDWKNFREDVCGELDGTNVSEQYVCISLHPVYRVDDSYHKMEECVGSFNMISIIKNENLRLQLTTNINEFLGDNVPFFKSEILFNSEYKGNLNDYIKETYGIDKYEINWELVIADKDNIYKNIKATTDPLNFFIFEKYMQNQSSYAYNELCFENSDGWKEGIYVMASAVINYGEGEISLMSDKFPFTLHMLEFFIQSKYTQCINLQNLNMNIYNINPVNEIVISEVKTISPNDVKSGIITPVFYRAHETNDIIIHPEVNEIISINLDSYKYKVDRFILRIEGINYNEFGRVSTGVLFKVNGGSLPGNITNGTYYILDQESDLVTTGKYKYVK